MKGIAKQETGFRFGTHKMEIVKGYGSAFVDGREYRVCLEVTDGKQLYKTIRLYNKTGRFIKRLAFEPHISTTLASLLSKD